MTSPMIEKKCKRCGLPFELPRELAVVISELRNKRYPRCPRCMERGRAESRRALRAYREYLGQSAAARRASQHEMLRMSRTVSL